MSSNPNVPLNDQLQGRHRHSIRLKEYDYAQSGAYFVTIVTCEREPAFGAIEGNAMRLSAWGEIARDEWYKSAEIRKSITLYADEFVVMPNHVHGIIWIGAERRSARTAEVMAITTGTVKPHVTAGSLGAVVRGYKSAVTYAVNAARGIRGAPIWQRNYYEHIIRDDADLNRIREYISNNPVKWGEDQLYV